MYHRRCPYNYNIDELHETAWKLSRQIIQMTTEAGSGHPSSSLSAIDVLVTLYFGGVMCYRPDEPDWPERDRFILSKGHGAPALYAVLAEAGYFEPDRLATLREIGSALEGHPNMRVLPGVEASTGSLGQGLSLGVGHALAAHSNGMDYHVYVMLGDGELDEGQVWEAAMSAAKFKLGNLTAILDSNKFQQTGPVREVMPAVEPIADKWATFGWDVVEIDGHRFQDILDALYAAQPVTGRPQLIIADTLKGRGLSPFQKDDVNRKHGVPLTPEEAEIALAELDEMKYDEAFSAEAFTPELTREDVQGEI